MSEVMTKDTHSPAEETKVIVNIEPADPVSDHEEKSPRETNDSEVTVRVPTPTLKVDRIDQLRDDGGSSSVYTSEDDGASHGSDECDQPQFEVPENDLKEKIINQVEFYFSDANILKDAFLLKHVRRNKMGYVSLKLITSFKKLKTLTKDYRVVAYSLKESEKLEVNEEGTKVRRRDPLPEYDETTPSRTVVAVNLPSENPTIETVAEIFSKCGEIVLIRVLRPGKTVPPDVKKHANKHPEIGTTVCAVVEFEKHEHAKKSCEEMSDVNDWRKGMRVVMLAPPKNAVNKKEKNQDNKQDKDELSQEEGKEDKKKRRRGGRKKKTRLEEIAGENESSCNSSGSEGEGPSKPQRLSPKVKDHDPNHLSPNPSPRTSPHSTPKSSPMSSPRSQRRGRGNHGKSPLAELSPGDNRLSPRSSPETMRKRFENSSGGESTPSSPWVQRRLRAAQELQDRSPVGSPRLGRRNPDGTLASGISPKMLDMEGVCRLPRGPDGTQGFYGGIGRGKPRSNTVC